MMKGSIIMNTKPEMQDEIIISLCYEYRTWKYDHWEYGCVNSDHEKNVSINKDDIPKEVLEVFSSMGKEMEEYNEGKCYCLKKSIYKDIEEKYFEVFKKFIMKVTEGFRYVREFRLDTNGIDSLAIKCRAYHNNSIKKIELLTKYYGCYMSLIWR